MSTSWHDSLLSTLTLGTARQDRQEELHAWLEAQEAFDPTDPPGTEEQLLTAWAITERLQRLQAQTFMPETPVAAPVEDRQYPPPRLSRALALILTGTYPHILTEALTVLEARSLLFPPHLLPELLEEAQQRLDDEPETAFRLLRAGGQRAAWLAGHNPAWEALSPGYAVAAAWAKEATPGKRAGLLRRWRQTDPVAAREALADVWSGQSPKNQETLVACLAINIGSEDCGWLRAQLAPKRKGVRRAILELLLLAGETQALNDLVEVATAAFDEHGNLVTVLKDTAAKDILADYGGIKRGEDIGGYLLGVLPPTTLPELTDRSLPEFWNTLNKAQLKAAAAALLLYPDLAARSEFVRFALRANPTQLPVEQVAAITATLPQEDFLAIFHELLTTEQHALHYGSLPRILALARTEPWSERISKAYVHQLVATLRELSQLPYTLQRDLQQHWKLSIPLLDPHLLGWLRTYLHSMTERSDNFGRLATEMLQTMAFRRVLWEE